MSAPPLGIIVLGPPGAGKTTLAHKIADKFRLPLIAKDDIKESLFDSLGVQDRAWSQQLGRATYELMYYFAATQLAAGRSFIIESNSKEHAALRFRALQVAHNFVPLQILCYAEPAVLVERFKARWASGNRHPGHVDDTITEQEFAMFRRHAPLDLGGEVIEIDTTDFARIDYVNLFQAIQVKL